VSARVRSAAPGTAAALPAAPAPRYATAMRLLIVLFAGLLAGCGFELRGADVLPPDLKNLYLVANIDVTIDFENFLETSDTRIVSSREQADVILTVVNPRYDRRVLSVDPTTGKEREYEIVYTVDVSAVGKQGRVFIPTQSVSLVRDFIYDPEAIIGTSREEAVLYVEMRRDAAQQILYRLRAATAG
jgi:LPS-assembly lipoprotein